MEPNTRSASSVASFDRVNSTTPRWRKRLSRSSRRSERSQSTSELRWSPSTRITRLFSTSKPCGTTTPSSPDGGLNFNSIQLPSTTAPGKTISFPTSSAGRHQFDASSRSFVFLSVFVFRFSFGDARKLRPLRCTPFSSNTPCSLWRPGGLLCSARPSS